jgi:hypothetical protein
MDIEKMKRYKSTVVDQIPAEFVQVGGSMVRSEIHKLINSIWNKKELPDSGRNQSFYLYIRVDLNNCSNYQEIHTKYYPTFFCQS